VIIAAMVIILLFGTGLVAVSRHIVSAGGFVVFVAHAFGSRAGSAMAFATVLAYNLAAIATYGVIGAFGAAALKNFLGLSVPFWVMCLVALVSVSALTFFDVTISVGFVATLLACEAAIVLAFDLMALVKGGSATAHPQSSFDFTTLFHGNIPMALIWAVALFGCFEITVVFGEEARNPRTTIRRATYAIVLLLGALYLLTTFVINDVFPAGQVVAQAGTDPANFLYRAASPYIGKTLTDVMSILVVTSMFASLIGVHSVLSRYLFSLGRARMLPTVFSRTHPRFKSPYIASFTQAGLSATVLVICIAYNLDPFTQVLGWFGSVGALGTEITFAITALAVGVVVARREAPGWWRTVAVTCSGAAFLACGSVSYFTIKNFPAIIGSTGLVSWLWLLYPALAIVGYLVARFGVKDLDLTTGQVG
jgi:amino acid transporter